MVLGSFIKRLRKPPNTPEFRGARPRQYERTEHENMLIQRDMSVPTRAGFNLWIDLFLPANATGQIPVLIAWTPYG